MTKRSIALTIARKLDDYEILDLNNASIDFVVEQIEKSLEDYLIIRGEVVKDK